MKLNRRTFLGSLATAALPATHSCGTAGKQTLHVIPNFHPAVMGWLAPYHVERNYCLYAYLDHQDHALKDPDYRYVLSEVPHLITMLERRPKRFEELKELARKGKTEMVNAFVVEPTVNLSGGEALVMQGVEGLRWYQQTMGLKPRHCWMIDVCGWHEQMAQIVAGLGLESFEYSRYNPTGTSGDRHGVTKEMDSIHWLESPDGSRTLAVNPDHYDEGPNAAFRTVRPPGWLRLSARTGDRGEFRRLQGRIDSRRTVVCLKFYKKECPWLCCSPNLAKDWNGETRVPT